jgi:AraC-like DNA-binding protein
MDVRYAPVPAALAPAVSAIWMARGAREEFAAADPIVPDGCVELVFNLGDPFVGRGDEDTVQPRAMLVGQMMRPVVATPAGRVDLIGLRFRTARAGMVLRTSMHALTDQMVDADEVLPRLHDLVDRLVQLRCERRVPEIARVFARRCARVDAMRLRPVEAALATIRASHGAIAVDRVASTAGVSRRHLERRFLVEVGLGVKQLARIVRVQSVLALLRRDPAIGGAEVAARLGYSDQAHLIHDCRALTGTTPARLRFDGPSLAALMREPDAPAWSGHPAPAGP